MVIIACFLVALTATLTSGSGPSRSEWYRLVGNVRHNEREIRQLCYRVSEVEEHLDHIIATGEQKMDSYHSDWESKHKVCCKKDKDPLDACELSCEGDLEWGYLAADGPVCWGNCVPLCNGVRQSPIDLTAATSVARTFNDPTLFLGGYDTPREGELSNNGHTATVTLTGPAAPAFASGLGLPSTYQAAQFHFHWGADSSRGSEHTINGRQYPMEMHIVHWNTDYASIGEAVDQPQGLAVVGFMFMIVPEDNPAFNDIISNLAAVASPGPTVTLEPFRLIDLVLLPDQFTHFYRYQGSLTTPNCFESVEWTVFTHPIGISENQLSEFRRLKTDGHGGPPQPLVDNFRPVQDLQGRAVYFSTADGINL